MDDGERDQEDFRLEYGNRAPRQMFRPCQFCYEEESFADTHVGWACKECAGYIWAERRAEIQEGKSK